MTGENITLQIVDGKDYLEQVKVLMADYTTRLGRDLSFQGIEEELANPEVKYSAPEGELLVALVDGEPKGMVAYHRHSDTRCEMKRLYLDPSCRGLKMGDKIVAAIIEHARAAGYREMVLDTVKPLAAAIHLYQNYGFEECAPYYDNPMDDVVYMKLAL